MANNTNKSTNNNKTTNKARDLTPAYGFANSKEEFFKRAELIESYKEKRDKAYGK